MTERATQDFHDARNPRLLSYSGIAAYQTCRHRWKLQNVYGLKAPLASRPMDLGSAVHAGLEHYLKLWGPPEEGIDRWVQRTLRALPTDGDDVLGVDAMDAHLTDIAENAKTVARRVLAEIDARGLTSYAWDSVESPMVEAEILIPLDHWDGFAVHLDWVAKDPKGRIWIVDFKVRSSFYGDDSEDVSLQNAIYQKVFRDEMGVDAAGTLTFQVRSDPAKQPKLTKKGEMSRAAIVCDWETYKHALYANGLDPADYADMEAKLSTVEFTRVLQAVRSPEEVQRVWDTIVLPLSVEMARVRDRALSGLNQERRIANLQAQRTLSQRTCSGCNVRDVCLFSLKGWDVSVPLTRFTYRKGIVATAIDEGTL